VRVADEPIEKAKAKLKVVAEEIKGLSQSMCPVDTGAMKGSAYVQEIENGWEIGYGGVAESYALEQHENLQYHHNVGQAKFLELAFIEITSKLAGRMENE
jgi:hypothetical protein